MGKMMRVQHPMRVLFFLTASLVTIGAAFFLGTFVKAPESKLQETSGITIPVYAKVENRSVTANLTAQGIVNEGTQLSIYAPNRLGAEQLVVTSLGLTIGSNLDDTPVLIAVISGRPLISIRSEIPLYRNLYFSDEGDDVSAFQDALGAPKTGVVDYNTILALQTIYETMESEPPGGWRNSYIDTSEFIAVDPKIETAMISSIAPVGSILDDDNPALTLTITAPRVAARIPTLDARSLAVETLVDIVSGSSESYSGKIVAIGDFMPATDSLMAGHDVEFLFLEPTQRILNIVGQRVTIILADEAAPTLAVPVIALRQDEEGYFVFKKISNSDSEDEIVSLEVLKHGGGFVSVETDSLVEGDEVLVSR